jgi:hypothetical protein
MGHNAADPNTNGVPNLIEYALGGDPLGTTTTITAALLPQLHRDSGTATQQFRLTRLLDRTDLILIVQSSDTLDGTWDNIAQSIAGGPFYGIASGVTATETGTGPTRNVVITALNPT